jgi:hypothetical protein
MEGISFVSLSITDLDSTAGTATVNFSVAKNGDVDFESEQWFVAKDDTGSWRLLGDQQIVDLNEFGFHCNDNNATDQLTGDCGINTSFEDNNVNNNGTNIGVILSARVSIISGDDGSVKDMFYIGTPQDSSQGQVYNEGNQFYSGDYRAFGSEAGEIDPSIFSVGDTVKHDLYESNLDLSDPENPAVVGDVVVSYSALINHEPQTVGKYPAATQETLDNLDNFILDEDITIAWTLAEGTHIDEIMVQISDPQGMYILSVWEEFDFSSVMSTTVDAAMFDDELIGNDEFDPSDGYTVTVRIYAEDSVTGQAHSVDYRVIVDAEPEPIVLACGHDSGWNDAADNELGAPITPNSFADFITVVTDCGGTTLITKANIAGTTWSEDGESITFNNDNLATEASPSTGQMTDDDVIDITWYIETVNGNTFIVIETNSALDSDLPANFWFRETYAITTVTGTLGASGTTYGVTAYSEQSNYSDTDRSTNADGEIWNSTFTQETTILQ